MSTRIARYQRLRARLQQLDDDQLRALIGPEGAPRSAWGTHQTIQFDGTPVFVKRIPVSDQEVRAPGSTVNHFALPPWYSYGIGSVGLGAFRELACLEKTTRWVLDGTWPAFPLLYRYRLLPLPVAEPRPTLPSLDGYISWWDGSEAVRRFMEARRAARYEAVVFLEHIPFTMQTWLDEHPQRAPAVLADLERTLAFLCGQGIVHFDAHLANVLTDGERVFLTDFGLALDRSFELSPAERDFLDAHRHYDSGVLIACLVHPLRARSAAWSPATQEALSARLGDLRPQTLVRHLETLEREGLLRLQPDYRALLIRQREVILWMHGVFDTLQKSPSQGGGYDDTALQAALERARS